MKVEFKELKAFLKWEYLLSYLGIEDDEDYYYGDNKLVIKRKEKFSEIEKEVVKDFSERRNYTYEIAENRIIIYLTDKEFHL